MTTSRQAYRIDKDNPGSDLAGETAAALAAASIVFRRSNPHYSHLLLHHAQQVGRVAHHHHTAPFIYTTYIYMYVAVISLLVRNVTYGTARHGSCSSSATGTAARTTAASRRCAATTRP
jgi:hypothetical protein